MKRILLIVLVILMLVLSLPVFAWSVEPNYASQIYVTVREYHSSWEDAPDEIFVTRWVGGVVYEGTIPKVSYTQYQPGLATVVYEGYIYPDESITPNHLTVPTVER